MPKGHSLHIGLNSVDPAQYEGWDGSLAACEFDAKDMAALAKKKKFADRRMLLTEQANSGAVTTAIEEAAEALKSGDIFFLTYSGHGGQVEDTNFDEKGDRYDETWVLFDRELVDDELFELYAKFKPGVRIIVLSDSCHSGTVLRAPPPRGAKLRGRPKLMPPDVGRRVEAAHRSLYRRIQKTHRAAERVKVPASVLLISGCQDNQTSLDGVRNGLFTATLKKVYSNGAFKGGYRRLRDQIVKKMPITQTPNCYRVGKVNEAFEAQSPFTI
jgi:metacaspase-1